MARKQKQTVIEETKVDVVVDNVEKENVVVEEPKAEEKKADSEKVLFETSIQLSIFRDFIYNVKNKGAVVVVENLGYGDAYISVDGPAVVGKSERLTFKQSKRYEGVERLYFASASQPVIQVVEVK